MHSQLLKSFRTTTALFQQSHHQHFSANMVLRTRAAVFGTNSNIYKVSAWRLQTQMITKKNRKSRKKLLNVKSLIWWRLSCRQDARPAGFSLPPLGLTSQPEQSFCVFRDFQSLKKYFTSNNKKSELPNHHRINHHHLQTTWTVVVNCLDSPLWKFLKPQRSKTWRISMRS